MISREVKWGVFVSSALMIMFLVFFLFGEFKFFKKGYNVFVTYNFTNGLEENAPVRLSGVNIGNVEDVSMAYDKMGTIHIIVKLWIKDDIILKEDARFYINTLGLLGEKYIEISPGLAASEPLIENSTILGIDPLSTEELFVKGNEIADNLRNIMNQLNDLISEETVKTVKDTMKSITGTMKAADALIGENRKNIKEVTTNLNKASAELPGIVKSFSRTSLELEKAFAGKGDKIASTIDELEKFSENLESVSAVLQMIDEKISLGEGNLGLLVQDDMLYKSMEKTLDEIRALIEDMKNNPRKYIKLSVF